MKVSGRLSRKGDVKLPHDSLPHDPPSVATDFSTDNAQQTSGDAAVAELDAILTNFHNELIDRLDVATLKNLETPQLRARIELLVQQILTERRIVLSERQRAQITGLLVDEITGLGPLEPLLADPSISDILVNTASAVYIERGGKLEQTSVRFRNNEHLLHTINRIVAKVGRRIDESSPMVDARLPDGSRVNAIIAPLALDGPLLSIRRFGQHSLTIAELAHKGALTRNMAQYLHAAVRARCNIIVAGGTGSGKTTMLNALSSFISRRERIVTIEDSAELRLLQPHVCRLETRPPNIEGKGEVTIRDLLRNALRMRPDRILVGEVRAAEVLDMIQAMNTGHEGSLTTVHANSAEDAVTRLMSMIGMSGTPLSEPMIMQLLGRAIDIVVHLGRHQDGCRRINCIAEVMKHSGSEMTHAVQLHDVFLFEQRGIAADGGVEGDFVCTGRSTLLSRFQSAGVPLDAKVLS